MASPTELRVGQVVRIRAYTPEEIRWQNRGISPELSGNVVPPHRVSGHEFRVVEVSDCGEFTLGCMHPRTRRLLCNKTLYGGAVASDLQLVDRAEEVKELLRLALTKADEYGLEVRASEDGLQRVFSVEPHRWRRNDDRP